MRTRSLLFCLSALLLGACTAPFGTMPDGCSGVPGDLRTPTSTTDHAARPARGEPVELTAVRRPFNAEVVPLLYVFDERARGVQTHDESGLVLRADPVFAKAQEDAYWFEVVDTSGYWVPYADQCSIASMLAEPFDFRAPAGGLHFVQFIPRDCEDCSGISAAIRALQAAHPELPVLWTRIALSKRIGGKPEPD